MLACVLLAGPVAAANPMLGQPLDHSVLLRSDGDEAFAPDCVSAEVTLGERKLPPAAVRVQLEPMAPDLARVRVRTTQPVDDLVVAVRITHGCVTRVTRQFVLLSDTPVAPVVTVPAPSTASAAALPPVAAAAAPLVPPAPVAEGAAPEPSPAPGRAATAAGPARAGRTERTPGRATAARDRPVRRAAADRPRPRAEARGAGVPESRLKLEPAAPVVAGGPAAPAAAAAAPPADLAAVEQALVVVAQAAEAARAAASAASAAQQRVAALESQVQRLEADRQRSEQAAVALRTELANSRQRSGPSATMLWLSLGAIVVSGAVGWHLGGRHRRRQQDWQQAALGGGMASRMPTGATTGGSAEVPMPPPAPPTMAPSATAGGRRTAAPPSRFDRDAGVSGFGPGAVSAGDGGPATIGGVPPAPSAVPARVKGSPVSPVPSPPRNARTAAEDSAFGRAPTAPIPLMTQELSVSPSPPPAERTEVLPPSVRLPEADASSRDVSIEELIDLEQQAEFFIVLGQDDAAIDLLVDHLRATGGGSPLPYLKLLEIHRRRGEQEAYDRIRARFNQRFNAYAPEWGSDLNAGRSLEGYPGVLPRLEPVWSRPLDAMAELEALLFRKSRGDLFDLPAYREVLFLYAIARDLLDREAVQSGNVDLLLPLADGSEFGPTTPRPYLSLDPAGPDTRPDTGFSADTLPAATDFGDLGGRPTAPLDLDVTAGEVRERRTSIFDPFDDRPQSGRR
jgi:hypothetical protein